MENINYLDTAQQRADYEATTEFLINYIVLKLENICTIYFPHNYQIGQDMIYIISA